MRVFLLALIALVAAGVLSLQSQGCPLSTFSTASAAKLEERGPFHANRPSLAARSEGIDPSNIPDQVGHSLQIVRRSHECGIV